MLGQGYFAPPEIEEGGRREGEREGRGWIEEEVGREGGKRVDSGGRREGGKRVDRGGRREVGRKEGG